MDRAILTQTIENLRKNGFDARLCRNQDEAKTLIAEHIIPYGTVGFGGSMTLMQLEVAQLARDHRAKTLRHSDSKLNAEERLEVARKALTSDLYLSSANAITVDGKIFNIDGSGNRVAALTFGPKKTIIVCGYNKIVADDEAAIERIKTITCPQNAKRLQRKTPCAELERCTNCQTEDRMCNITAIMEKRPRWADIMVIIIEEELGY